MTRAELLHATANRLLDEAAGHRATAADLEQTAKHHRDNALRLTLDAHQIADIARHHATLEKDNA